MKKDGKRIEAEVKKILSKQLNVDVKKISGDSLLRNDLGMDSFASLEIIYDIRDAFGIEVPDAYVKNLKMVKDVLDFVRKNL